MPKATLRSDIAKVMLMGQIRVHSKVKHPHICNFDAFFEDEFCIYILLEYCPHKTLHHMLRQRKKLTEFEVRYFMLQLF
jgi:cell cycle serine/threonine-protein kinase CDC5/MSD2